MKVDQFLVDATTPPLRRIELLDVLAADGATDSRVQSVARLLHDTLTDSLQRQPTPAEMAQWLLDALRLLVDYVPDPTGDEVFHSVHSTLSGAGSAAISPITNRPKGRGDAEALVSVFVALCHCASIPAKACWWDQPGQAFNHISAKVQIDGKWLDAETTIPGARIGESPYLALASAKRCAPART